MAIQKRQQPDLQLVYMLVQDECPKCKGKRARKINGPIMLYGNMLVVRKRCSRCGCTYRAETAYVRRAQT